MFCRHTFLRGRFFLCIPFIYMLRSLVSLFVLSLWASADLAKSCEWQFYRIKPKNQKKNLKFYPDFIFWVENLRFCCHRAENIYFVVFFEFFSACIWPTASHLLRPQVKRSRRSPIVTTMFHRIRMTIIRDTRTQPAALHTRILSSPKTNTMTNAHTQPKTTSSFWNNNSATRTVIFYLVTNRLKVVVSAVCRPAGLRPTLSMMRNDDPFDDDDDDDETTESSESSMMPRSNPHTSNTYDKCGPVRIVSVSSFCIIILFYFFFHFIYLFFCPVKSSMTNRFEMCFLLVHTEKHNKHNKCGADGWMGIC